MPKAPSKQTRDVATEVWRHLFGFFLATHQQRGCVLEELGLTPNDARALTALKAGDGVTMSRIASRFACDASNVTSIVDRLEELGFAERRTVPADRRIKQVVLTPRGRSTLEKLHLRLFEPPPELLQLDHAALSALRDAVARLPVEGDD